MRFAVMGFALLGLVACVTPPGEAPPAPDAEVHRFSVDRAYSLGDRRELSFRDQIAAQARSYCGLGGYSLFSQTPVGSEQVREDFIYRQYDVAITCDG
jgi:putative hemolysin